MAPLPDNNKTEQDNLGDKSSQKDEKKLSNLNDRELKALLDEAINYKNPKDREGKSELFNDLLLEAEESERIARATSAGGSELVRHCNQQARRQRGHGGGPRGRRSGGPTAGLGRSVSERGTHGGSLDNLAKEELYETSRRLRGVRKSSTSSSGGASSGFCGNQVRVSARQREGGSLPCNVNSGGTPRDFMFSQEECKNKEMKEREHPEDVEKERLLENDLLARGYEERLIDGERASGNVETHIVTATPKYTSKATLQIQSNRVTAVDEPILLDLDPPHQEKKIVDAQSLSNAVNRSKFQVIIPAYPAAGKTVALDGGGDKFFYFQKVDENGNALHHHHPHHHQAKDLQKKKKKQQTDKNVVVLRSENIEGHKSEIIHNVDRLVHYIEGTTELRTTRAVQSRAKQLQKQHVTEEGGGGGGTTATPTTTTSNVRNRKKQKSKDLEEEEEEKGEVRSELKKSNSLGEISGIKLDRQFSPFGGGKVKKGDEEEEGGAAVVVVLRTNKSLTDRARERRSWGTVEPLYSASSLEHLETSTDNWEVTRPKKKNKKRRNSVSSTSSVRQTTSSSISGVSSLVSPDDGRGARRARSPNLGSAIVGGACNVKKTRSMPHSERSNDSSSDVDSVHSLPLDGPISYADIAKNSEKKKPSPEKQQTSNPVNAAPDVHNIKSFPAIPGGEKGDDTTVMSSVVETSTPEGKRPAHPKTVKKPTQGGARGDDVPGNDTSFFSQLMRDSTLQYRSQRMPPDIVDVSTIEKMQLMNCPGIIDNFPVTPVTPDPPPPHHRPLGGASSAPCKRKKGPAASSDHIHVIQNCDDASICDTSFDETKRGGVSTNKMVNGISGEDTPPAVVILSSGPTRDAPPPSGLVFGFDINEQLLLEDSEGQTSSENKIGDISIELLASLGDRWAQRYKPPTHDGFTKHNHDKIVQFIAEAWEDVLNQKIQYYSHGL
ncbi:uncharacterized protein LOC126747970 isoform X2 [Anthonomus grandis grandis]|uniref:uncharacterized protein LOC126747970 isoform X2 n=1 Tax=Anthonomus grandis grandis TaxID=2921223 RepID=UPI0021661716|nr:uncharacterized protein LOC126747970 isoform X2 [Anthonomus grandis grandis]